MAEIKHSRVLPGRPSEVFALLSAPEHIPELLAPFMDVKLIDAATELKREAEYVMEITRFGISQQVRFHVDDVLPGSHIQYHLSESLFQRWSHRVLFAEHSKNSTLVTDYVDYQIPFGLFGRIFDDLVLRRDFQRMIAGRLDHAEKMSSTS